MCGSFLPWARGPPRPPLRLRLRPRLCWLFVLTLLLPFWALAETPRRCWLRPRCADCPGRLCCCTWPRPLCCLWPWPLFCCAWPESLLCNCPCLLCWPTCPLRVRERERERCGCPLVRLADLKFQKMALNMVVTTKKCAICNT